MEIYVAEGFEPVRAAFAANTAELGDGGGASCAYVDGEPVVDVWAARSGRAGPGRPATVPC